MREQRKKYLVDKSLQWKLAKRLLLTWLVGGGLILFFPLTLTMLYSFWLEPVPFGELMSGVFRSIWLPLLTALLVIPMGLRDSIRFSNRIAGPMFRLRREMNRLLDGEKIEPVKLRKKDCFTDFADDFNRLSEELQQLRKQMNEVEPANEDAVAQEAELVESSP